MRPGIHACMTLSSYTHYILIIDRSGSMISIRDDTEGGIRTFADEQGKLPGKSTLTLAEFDDKYSVVLSFSPLKKAENYRLIPGGMTALLDAVGRTVTAEGEHLAAMDEGKRPSKVVVVIATDGQENSSREYTRERVRELISHQQEKYGWEFVYIGANQDSFAEARSMGISMDSTLDYNATSMGTRSAWRGTTQSVGNYVSGQSRSVAYNDEDRKASTAG